jgi:hypothetical protein
MVYPVTTPLNGQDIGNPIKEGSIRSMPKYNVVRPFVTICHRQKQDQQNTRLALYVISRQKCKRGQASPSIILSNPCSNI